MEEKLLFCAPGFEWKITEDGLQINNYIFKGTMSRLFPEYYYYCAEGITLASLEERFNDYPGIKLRKFTKKLISFGILIDNIQEIDHLFAPQGRIFQSEKQYSENFFLDSENLTEFVSQQMKRVVAESDVTVELLECERPLYINERKSVRLFSTDLKVSKQQFSETIEIMSQHRRNGQCAYYYPSAGGLYPIDCYVHVKKNRVEGVPEGLYYADCVNKTIMLISDGSSFNKGMHFHLNQEIYETSAFSIYLFYNADASMPKYRGRAYYYAILDAGILSGYLTIASSKAGLSCCSIGEMKFDQIKNEFSLLPCQRFLHSIEFGVER